MPQWVAVGVGLTLVLALGWASVMTYLHLVNNPLPFPDKGSTTFACTDSSALEVISRILLDNGYKIRRRADSGYIQRRILSGAVIINTTDPEVHASMGNPPAAIGMVVDNPLMQARVAVRLLQAAGFEAEIVSTVDVDLPPNHLVFVRTNAMSGCGLIFRRSILTLVRATTRAS